MIKSCKKIKKVNDLIKKANHPKWLHHFGSKKYELADHILALLVKQECKLSYRRATRLLSDFGIKAPKYNTLCVAKKRIPLHIWQQFLWASIKGNVHLAAIDGSGMSRPLPSPHYYKRIDKPYPIEVPLKLSMVIDTKSKQILALRLRAKSAHDSRDVKYLVNRLKDKPTKLIADKGYDAEWIHQFCKSKGIFAVIPIRNWGKVRHKNFSLRRLSQKMWTQNTYGRREMVEAAFSAIKRKFGCSVSSNSMCRMRAEMYLRAIAHNLELLIQRLFEQSL